MDSTLINTVNIMEKDDDKNGTQLDLESTSDIPIVFNRDKHLATKLNALIESARMRFSAMQQRVIHTALSQIAKDDVAANVKWYQEALFCS